MSAGKVNRVYSGSECSVMVILNRLSRERLTEYRHEGNEEVSRPFGHHIE